MARSLTLPRSLRELTVYGNPIGALPEALVLHSAQAGLLLWRVCALVAVLNAADALVRPRNPYGGAQVMQVAE